MISEVQLRRLARELDVRLGYAEKNYVNSWILWAIYTSPYGDNLRFEGGTALSKCPGKGGRHDFGGNGFGNAGSTERRTL
jgi:predicted nucleotidyltransferase component of viral defense system